MAQSKRYKALLKKVPESPVALEEAVKLLKTFDGTNFDQTVEIHMNLGIDAKQADQLVRGSLVLPNGIGKTQRVVVFAKDAAAEAAKKGVELEPEAGHIIDTLAHLEYMQGNLDKAITLTEQAVELSGDQFPEIAEFLEKLKEEKAGDEEVAGDDKEDDGE